MGKASDSVEAGSVSTSALEVGVVIEVDVDDDASSLLLKLVKV